jgi:hypothetical protein
MVFRFLTRPRDLNLNFQEMDSSNSVCRTWGLPILWMTTAENTVRYSNAGDTFRCRAIKFPASVFPLRPQGDSEYYYIFTIAPDRPSEIGVKVEGPYISLPLQTNSTVRFQSTTHKTRQLETPEEKRVQTAIFKSLSPSNAFLPPPSLHYAPIFPKSLSPLL